MSITDVTATSKTTTTHAQNVNTGTLPTASPMTCHSAIRGSVRTAFRPTGDAL
jgi:hypothetical protein